MLIWPVKLHWLECDFLTNFYFKSFCWKYERRTLGCTPLSNIMNRERAANLLSYLSVCDLQKYLFWNLLTILLHFVPCNLNIRCFKITFSAVCVGAMLHFTMLSLCNFSTSAWTVNVWSSYSSFTSSCPHTHTHTSKHTLSFFWCKQSHVSLNMTLPS